MNAGVYGMGYDLCFELVVSGEKNFPKKLKNNQLETIAIPYNAITLHHNVAKLTCERDVLRNPRPKLR